MKKDVVYIDTEDDITAIITKVSASKEKIVALVPPARAGVLQSAVNMRLLQRTAEQAGKRVVIVSNNQSLAMLASTAKIPVARTLQSKPELAEVPILKVDDGDIIDGEDLPVGDLAEASATDKMSSKAIDAAIQSADKQSESPAKDGKKKPKVPNFTSFRKKFLIIGGVSLALVGFLVWAIWFAPKATVVITAKTTTVTVDENVRLTTDGETDISSRILRATKQEQEQELSVQFTATGEKNAGEKATGTVELFSDANLALMKGISIPAGTKLNSFSGKVYITDQAVKLTNSHYTEKVRVTAAEPGESYNGATGSLVGAPASVEAKFIDATAGGTNKMVKVVIEDDIKKATEALNEKKVDSLSKTLAKTFGSSSIAIESSYSEERGEPVPSIKVDEEANGPVSLKTTVKASMLAVDHSQLSKFIKANLQEEISGKFNQKIYDDGTKNVKFSQFSERNGQPMVRLTANGKVGPEIKEGKVKEKAKGRRYGDIQSSFESIDGVSNVDVKFSPFWVRVVPDNVDRIKVEFKLQNAS